MSARFVPPTERLQLLIALLPSSLWRFLIAMYKELSVVAIILSGAASVIETGYPWESINTTDEFKTLDTCQQKCLLDVKDHIKPPTGPCDSYGCVCSEHTLGLNAVTALQYISSCVRTTCPDSRALDAVKVFEQLCVLPQGTSESAVPTNTKLTSPLPAATGPSNPND